MAAGWRYFATRLAGDGTEEPLAWDLPLSGVELTDTLSGPGALSATISPEAARLKDESGRAVFVPWSTAVYAEASGQIRGGGILTPSSTLEGPSCSLDCVGFAGYPTGMPYTHNRSWVGADPLDLVRHIWEHLQGHPGGDLGVVVDEDTSPVRIGTDPEAEDKTNDETAGGAGGDERGPYRLNWWSTTDLGSELAQLAEATPFDFREEHQWAGDAVRHRLRLGYPRLGRRREERFVVGENVTVVPTVGYSDDYASEVLMLGAGEGRKMTRGRAHRPDGRLRRVAVVSDKSLRTSSAADRAAERQVRALLGAPDISEVVVADHPHAPVGSLTVGDDICVQVPERAGWAGRLDLWVRITQMTTSPDAAGAVTLTVARTDRTGG